MKSRFAPIKKGLQRLCRLTPAAGRRRRVGEIAGLSTHPVGVIGVECVQHIDAEPSALGRRLTNPSPQPGTRFVAMSLLLPDIVDPSFPSARAFNSNSARQSVT